MPKLSEPLVELTVEERALMKAARIAIYGRPTYKLAARQIGGISFRTVRSWEDGERRVPLERYRRWCVALGFDPEKMLRGIECQVR